MISLADTSVKPLLRSWRRVDKIYKQQVCALIITPLAFVLNNATRVTNVLVNIQGGNVRTRLPVYGRKVHLDISSLAKAAFRHHGVMHGCNFRDGL